MSDPALSPAGRWSEAGWRAHLPGHADPGRLAARLGSVAIPALAAGSARRAPGRVAFTVDGEPVTHAGLDAGARGVAAWLAPRIARGDRVLLAAGTSLGFLRCYLGTLRAGGVVVLANPGYTAAELGHLVGDSGARIAFADPEPAGRLAGLAEAPLTVPVAGAGWLDAASGPEPRPVRPGDTAVLAYTSGTTGRPKGVPLTHRQLAASIQSAMAAWRWTAGDVLACALPLFHQHGLSGVHATLAAGSTAHLRSRPGPAGLLALIAQAGATVLFGVPATYLGLLDEAGPAAGPVLRGLRLAVCGSAPLSPALAARLAAVAGRVPLVRYGTTESGLDVSNPVDGARPDTVGLPLPGIYCRVWSDTAGPGGGEAPPGTDGEAPPRGDEVPPGTDGEAPPRGDEVPPGTDGEIQVRGPQVFTGYWHDRAGTEQAFTADGWFRTGDIGTVDPASGHLVIRGRIKELIITGGLNVYPREVELALETHPAVAEAAVAALPHPRWGEQVTAWVVLRPGHDFRPAGLIAHARTRLAAYKCPKEVFRLAELPRTPVGKLDRRALPRGPRAR